MFTIEYAKDLQWDNAEHSHFICIVKYEEINEELPVGVNGIDPYPHIREIWTKGIAGEYGQIAEYVEPIQQEVEPAQDQPAASGVQEI